MIEGSQRDQYCLSLDARLEAGWVYRAELRTPGRFDLFNDLSPSDEPVVQSVSLGDYRLMELPADVYERVVDLRGVGRDDEYSEAEGILREFRDRDGMYLVARVEGADLLSAATAEPPFGPEFGAGDLGGVDAMEVWGTRFSRSGGDFVEFRLMQGGAMVAAKRVAGY